MSEGSSCCPMCPGWPSTGWARRPTKSTAGSRARSSSWMSPGFTALTERLAARGRAGTEEINEIVSSTFGELAGIAGPLRGRPLEMGRGRGGPAVPGPGSAPPRGTVWLADGAGHAPPRPALRPRSGGSQLKVSVGAHSGAFELFLIGESTPGADRRRPRRHADYRNGSGRVRRRGGGQHRHRGFAGGQRPRRRAAAPASCFGANRPAEEPRCRPYAARTSRRMPPCWSPNEPGSYLLSGEEQAEHRPMAIGFVRLSGLDDVIERFGATAALEALRPPVRAAQAGGRTPRRELPRHRPRRRRRQDPAGRRGP